MSGHARSALLLFAIALALALVSCAGSHLVPLPVVVAPRLGLSPGGRLEVGTFDAPALGGLAVGEEVRRYLESELRTRVPPGAERPRIVSAGAAPDADASAASLVLTGKGELEEFTVAALPSAEPAAPGGLDSPVPRRPRWAHGYRLSLVVEIRDRTSGDLVWSERFVQDHPPSERGAPLFVLYDLLDPVADAVVKAVLGGKETEKRFLLVR